MAGDFELLSTYITIRTRGLDKVLSAFSQINQAADRLRDVSISVGTQGGGVREMADAAQRFNRQLENARLFMLQIQTSGRTQAQQLQALVILEQRIRALMLQRNLSSQQQIRLQTLLKSVLSQQALLQTRAARQAAAAQAAAARAVNAGAASLNKMATAVGNMQREVRQLLNSISLELGFAAPFLRLGTNVFRVSQSFRQLARVAGASAGAIRLAGVAGGALTVGLAGLNAALGIAGRLLATVARIAAGVLRQGFQILLGPTLALVRAFRLLVQNLPLVAAGFAALATRSLVNIAQQFQRIESTFRFAFGPTAQQEMQFIRELADRMGVSLLTIADNYGRMASAARDAGLSQRELQTLFEGTSAAAVALGLDTERVGGLFFAFEQIISKGRVAAEELRRQIGDRLPGAFTIAARAMRVTTQQLDEMLRRGEIDAVTFVRALGPELLRTFSGAAEAASTRLVATLERMRNAFLQIGEAIATRLEPGFTRLINRVIDLAEAISQSAGFQRFVTFMSQQLDALERNFDRIVGGIVEIWGRLSPTLERLGRVMFTLNTTAVGVLVEGFARLAESSGRVVGVLERMTTAITGVDLSQVSISIEGIIAILSDIPALLDIIQLQFRRLLAAARVWYLETNIFFRLIGDQVINLGRAFATIFNLPGGGASGSTAAQELQQLTAELDRQTAQLEVRLARIRAGFSEAGGSFLTQTNWSLIVDDAITAADEVSRVWEEAGAGIAANFSSAFGTVKRQATDLVSNLIAGFQRTQEVAGGSGISGVTGGGGRVTVLASRGLPTVDRTATETRRTADNTQTLVAIGQALATAMQTLPFDVAGALRPQNLSKPGGGNTK